MLNVLRWEFVNHLRRAEWIESLPVCCFVQFEFNHGHQHDVKHQVRIVLGVVDLIKLLSERHQYLVHYLVLNCFYNFRPSFDILNFIG
jgi:hypothetical protein